MSDIEINVTHLQHLQHQQLYCTHFIVNIYAQSQGDHRLSKLSTHIHNIGKNICKNVNYLKQAHV